VQSRVDLGLRDGPPGRLTCRMACLDDAVGSEIGPAARTLGRPVAGIGSYL